MRTLCLCLLVLMLCSGSEAMVDHRFRPGESLRAYDINNIVDALLHQITGGKGIQVRTFGDRLIVSKDARAKAPLAKKWEVVFYPVNWGKNTTFVLYFNGNLWAGVNGDKWFASPTGAEGSWEYVTGPPILSSMIDAIVFNGYMYVGGTDRNRPPDFLPESAIYRSSDGTTWTEVWRDTRTIARDNPWHFAVHNSVLYMFAHTSGTWAENNVYSTPDGTTWTLLGDCIPATSTYSSSPSIKAVSDGTYIYVTFHYRIGASEYHYVIRRSTNGVSWASVLDITLSATPINSGGGLDYKDGVFLAGMYEGFYTSEDGTTWTLDPDTSLEKGITIITSDGRWRAFAYNTTPKSKRAGSAPWTDDALGDGLGGGLGITNIYCQPFEYNGYVYQATHIGDGVTRKKLGN